MTRERRRAPGRPRGTAGQPGEAGDPPRLLPRGTLLERATYLVCRPVHFIVMAVSVPAAYLAVHAMAPGRGLPGALIALVWISAAIWAMFHFVMHGYAYPTNAREALMVTVFPILNLATAGAHAFTTGALSVVMASMLALSITLAALLVILSVPSLTLRLVPQAPPGSWKLVGGLLPGVLLLTWAFGGPFQGLAAAPRGGWGWVLVFSFVAQVASELRLLYAGSVFSGPQDPTSERWALTAGWMPLTILCMLGALLGFSIVLLWSAR